MDIKGKYIQLEKNSNRDHYIEIDDEYICYFYLDLRSDSYSLLKVPYKLNEARNLSDLVNYDIDVFVTDVPKPDFVCHIEKIEDKEITIISSMTFEADGRGRIVIGTYVREQDIDRIPTAFESSLFTVCNKRMVNTMKMPAFTFSDSGPMMGQGFPLNNISPKAKRSPWGCSCGHKGNEGNFCLNCGAMVPQK